jgi:hypothetical protein
VNRATESDVTIENQVLMDGANRGRTFTDCGRDPFGRSGAHVADGEQSGMAGLERQGRASERFPGPLRCSRPSESIRKHKPSVVQGGVA